MRDVVVLAIAAAFFLVCVAYVRWCDRIIGPDPDLAADEPDHTATTIADGDADLIGRA